MFGREGRERGKKERKKEERRRERKRRRRGESRKEDQDMLSGGKKKISVNKAGSVCVSPLCLRCPTPLPRTQAWIRGLGNFLSSPWV